MRLRHAQLPEEARDLDKELRALLKEKDAAVRGQVCPEDTAQSAVMLDEVNTTATLFHCPGTDPTRCGLAPVLRECPVVGPGL